MTNLKTRFIRFFTLIDYPILGKSCIEALWLSAFAFLPLLLNIILNGFEINNYGQAFKNKIVPFEMFSYCLGFIAPSMYIVVKANASKYKLPLFPFFFFITLTLYVICLFTYIAAKNKWLSNIDAKHHNLDHFFLASIYFLGISFLLRIYAVYHGRRSSNYFEQKDNQQTDFNSKFVKKLDENGNN